MCHQPLLLFTRILEPTEVVIHVVPFMPMDHNKILKQEQDLKHLFAFTCHDALSDKWTELIGS